MVRQRFTSRYTDVVISGLAHVDAPHVVTSAEIEAQIEPLLERLQQRGGLLERVVVIKERRFWDPGALPSTHAAEAGERALAASGVRREDLGMLVNTSVSRDYIEPSTASIVHGAMGLSPLAGTFDIGNACLGFLNGMNFVAAMIEREEIDHGLVVCAESARHAVESTLERLRTRGDAAMFREQFATLTVGSGAVAMVLSRAGTVASESRYLGGLSRSATEHALLCTGQLDEMRTDTKGLLEAGREVGAMAWKEAVDAFGWDPRGFDLYAVHQVSTVHTKAVCEKLNLDRAKFPLTFPTFGNIGPASVPLVLSKAAERGDLQHGDRVALMGIGSGINATAAEVRW